MLFQSIINLESPIYALNQNISLHTVATHENTINKMHVFYKYKDKHS